MCLVKLGRSAFMTAAMASDVSVVITWNAQLISNQSVARMQIVTIITALWRRQLADKAKRWRRLQMVRALQVCLFLLLQLLFCTFFFPYFSVCLSDCSFVCFFFVWFFLCCFQLLLWFLNFLSIVWPSSTICFQFSFASIHRSNLSNRSIQQLQGVF